MATVTSTLRMEADMLKTINRVVKGLDEVVASAQKISDTPDSKAFVKILADVEKVDAAAKKAEETFRKVTDPLSDVEKQATKTEGALDAAFTAGIIKATLLLDALKSVARELKNSFSDGLQEAIGLESTDLALNFKLGADAPGIDSWAKGLIDDFGVTELQAKKAVSGMSTVAIQAGLTRGAAIEMSKSFVEAAGDMSALGNASVEQVLSKMESYMVGNNRAMREFGINVNDAILNTYAFLSGMEKTVKEMTAAEKATLRYNYALEAMSQTEGAHQEAMKTTAGMLSSMRNHWSEVTTSVAAEFLPAIKIAIKLLYKTLSATERIVKQTGTATRVISGLAVVLASALIPALIGAIAKWHASEKAALAAGRAWMFASKTTLAFSGMGVAVAALIYLYGKFDETTNKIIIGLGLLVGAIAAAKASMMALTAVGLTNPFLGAIFGITAFIGLLMAAGGWIDMISDDHIELKYQATKAWNAIQDVVDVVNNAIVSAVASTITTVVNFWHSLEAAAKIVWAGIQTGWDVMLAGMLTAVEVFANAAIAVFNSIIDVANKIPGVNVKKKEKVAFGRDAIGRVGSNANDRLNKISEDFLSKTEKTTNYWEDIQRGMEEGTKIEAAGRKAEEKRLKALYDASKKQAAHAGFSGSGIGDVGNVGKVGSVGKVDKPVQLDESHIRLLKDVAKAEYINKFTTMRPEVKVTFGDVKETADVEQILKTLENSVVGAYETALSGA